MLAAGEIQHQRQRSLSISEIMTILIHFHQSHYRHFKAYYTEYVLERLRGEFPGLVSYQRFGVRAVSPGASASTCARAV